jgi:hypothetical protein
MSSQEMRTGHYTVYVEELVQDVEYEGFVVFNTTRVNWTARFHRDPREVCVIMSAAILPIEADELFNITAIHEDGTPLTLDEEGKGLIIGTALDLIATRPVQHEIKTASGRTAWQMSSDRCPFSPLAIEVTEKALDRKIF